LQEGQEGSFAGHLLGGVTVWAFRADWLVGAFGLSVAELEAPGALNWGWGWRVGGFALEGAAKQFDTVDEHVIDGVFVCC
jgi:hypothetical protein